MQRTSNMQCERRLEFNKDAFFCFVDFEKAFDRVKWTKLLEVGQVKFRGLVKPDIYYIKMIRIDPMIIKNVEFLVTDDLF